MRTYSIAQGTLFNALWWPKREGNPKQRGYIYTLFNYTLFQQAKRISFPHPQILKVREVEKDCEVFVIVLEGGILMQLLNSSECHLRPILMPHSSLSAFECLLPPYKGCFLNNNPGSIICHFHQVPALYSYTFRNVNHLYKTVRAVTSPAAWEKKSKHSLWRALSNRVSYSRCGEWGVLPVRHAGGVDSGVLGGQLPEF